MGVLYETGTAYPSQAPEFTPDFWLGACYSSILLLFYYVSVGSEFRVVLSATVTGNVGSVVSLLEFVSNCNVE